MQRCLTCHAVYDDKQEFCEKDGTPLLGSTSLTPTHHVLKGKSVFINGGAIVIVAGIIIFAFGIFYIFNQQPEPPAPEKMFAPSPEKRDEIRQPSSDPAPELSKNKPGYFVIGLSSREQADAIQEMERRNQTGHQTHVTYSSQWSDLSPGYYVLVYGVFDTIAEATAAANELKSRDAQVYVKYSGSLKTDGVEAISAPRKPHKDMAKTQVLGWRLVHIPEPEAGQRLNADPVTTVDPNREAAVKQSGAISGEAVSEVMKLWEQHFTRCGDSYVSLGSNSNLRQLRGVNFVVSQGRPLTKADELDGFEWSGQVKAKWNVWRRATRRNSDLVWGDWKESPQSFTFDVSKKNSRWKVLNSIYDQKKVECPDLP